MLSPARYKQVTDASAMASSARVSANSAVQLAGCGNRSQDAAFDNLIAPILKAPFAQDQWSQRYLRSLGPTPDDALILSVFYQRPHRVLVAPHLTVVRATGKENWQPGILL